MTNRPRIPPGLKKDGKKFFRKIIEDFELENHHLEILKQAAKCLDDLSLDEKTIESEGRFFTDRYGQPKEHPAVTATRQTRGLFQRLIREVGLDIIDTSDSRPIRNGG